MSIISAFSSFKFLKIWIWCAHRGFTSSQTCTVCGTSYYFLSSILKENLLLYMEFVSPPGLTEPPNPHLLTPPRHLPRLIFLWKLFYFLVQTGIQESLIIWKWRTDPGMAASYLLCWISFCFSFLMVLLYMWIHLQFRFVLFRTFTHFGIICNPYLLDWAKKS